MPKVILSEWRAHVRTARYRRGGGG